jgi:predicted Zn-dependent peptidase
MRRTLISLLIGLAILTPAAARGRFEKNMSTKIAGVFLPNRSPLVTFRLQLMIGAAADPNGKEGVAALTAAMLAQGGSRTMTYEQIVEAMYPMATSFGWQIDKEMTVFTGTTHVDNLDKYYGLISQMLLDPGFRADDFSRLKTDAVNFLKVSLRESNDEELGKEYLYNIIYSGHPYEHHNMGTVSSIEKLTLDDVRGFYKVILKTYRNEWRPISPSCRPDSPVKQSLTLRSSGRESALTSSSARRALRPYRWASQSM